MYCLGFGHAERVALAGSLERAGPNLKTDGGERETLRPCLP